MSSQVLRKILVGLLAGTMLASASVVLAGPTVTGALASSPTLGAGIQPTQMSNTGLFTTPDGPTKTYRYAGVGFAQVATPTDYIIIQGSATKTCRIKFISIHGGATAAGNEPVVVYRRLSSGGSIGSAVLSGITAANNDTNNAAATCVVSTVGTANYTTVQTSAGILSVGRAEFPALGSGVAAVPFVRDYTSGGIVLRGTSDYVAINGNSAAIPSGGVIDYEIVIEEDNS